MSLVSFIWTVLVFAVSQAAWRRYAAKGHWCLAYLDSTRRLQTESWFTMSTLKKKLWMISAKVLCAHCLRNLENTVTDFINRNVTTHFVLCWTQRNALRIQVGNREKAFHWFWYILCRRMEVRNLTDFNWDNCVWQMPSKDEDPKFHHLIELVH